MFVGQMRVPAVEAWPELTAGEEFICIGQPVRLYDVRSYDADQISVKEAAEDLKLIPKWFNTQNIV